MYTDSCKKTDSAFLTGAEIENKIPGTKISGTAYCSGAAMKTITPGKL